MIQEQIVEYEGQVAAFVQTRGSMPFLWTQTPCIRYMPMPNVEGNEQVSLIWGHTLLLKHIFHRF